MAFGLTPEDTFAVLKAVRGTAGSDVFLLAKLTPMAGGHIVRIAKAAIEAGADALTIANTYRALAIDPVARKAKIGAGFGGLPGPGIRPITVGLIRDVYKAGIGPIVGVGGIDSAEAALEYLLAGAQAVQIGTGLFKSPLIFSHVFNGLIKLMDLHQAAHISDLVGSLDM